jgi:hypothetical protein
VAPTAVTVFIMASFLFPETLGRDLSAKGFEADTETEAMTEVVSASGA